MQWFYGLTNPHIDFKKGVRSSYVSWISVSWAKPWGKATNFHQTLLQDKYFLSYPKNRVDKISILEIGNGRLDPMLDLDNLERIRYCSVCGVKSAPQLDGT